MRGRYNVLFLCRGNSARSVMAEAIMNKKGFPTFAAYSAGSHPKGTVHPAALRQIELANLTTTGLRSKDWSEFAKPGAPDYSQGWRPDQNVDPGIMISPTGYCSLDRSLPEYAAL